MNVWYQPRVTAHEVEQRMRWHLVQMRSFLRIAEQLPGSEWTVRECQRSYAHHQASAIAWASIDGED